MRAGSSAEPAFNRVPLQHSVIVQHNFRSLSNVKREQHVTTEFELVIITDMVRSSRFGVSWLGQIMHRISRYFFRASLAALLVFAVIYAQTKPAISVSPARVKSGDPVMLTGTGFTPNRSVMSHLR